MSKVEQFYNANPQWEWDRESRHRTEFAVTRRAFEDYLPPAPAKLADIGGGPGRYSIPLAGRGYEVTLVDLAQENLNFAREQAAEAGVELAAYLHADARDLSNIEDATFDAVLLMGPLYHLLEPDDRRRAVSEAYRILMRGGVIFAAFICRYAPFRYAAKFDPDWLVANAEQAARILATGVNISGESGYFTDAYFAHPSDVLPLMEGGGFSTLDLMGVEGIVARIEEQVNNLQGVPWDTWVDLNYRVGKDPALYGAAEHLLYIGQRA